MTTRVLFGPFRAQGINLSSSDFVAGVPSPSAALGFVGAISRRLGVPGWGHRAILIIHELQENRGRIRGQQRVKSGTLVPLEVPETMTGHGVFSIIGEVPGHHDLSSLTDAFMRARFAGGTIFSVAPHSLTQAVRPIRNLDIHRTLSRLPRGMILSPPTSRPDAAIVSFGEETSLEALALRAYSPDESRGCGYLVPVPAGYRILLETLTDTPPPHCRSSDIPFALVDSAVGLGEYISIRNPDAFEDADDAFSTCSWSWASTGELRMFSPFHLSAVRP